MRVDMYQVSQCYSFRLYLGGSAYRTSERELDISTLWSALPFRMVTAKQRCMDLILLCLSFKPSY